MAKMLTAAAAARIRPRDIKFEVRDGGAPGLKLLITPAGHRSWVVRMRRPDGRAAKLTLGPADFSGRQTQGDPKIGQPLTLAEARVLAAEAHRQRASGRDPAADRQAEKQRSAEGRTETFEAVAHRFIEEHCRPRNRGWRAAARALGLDPRREDLAPVRGGLAERWRLKPIKEITGADIYTVVDEARRRSIPGMGARTEGLSDSRGRYLVRILSKMFAWATQHRMVEQNPCVGAWCPPAPPARDRVLTNDEIRRVWAAAEQVGKPFSTLLRLLLLTGCRLSEIAELERSEIRGDGEAMAIHLPAARTKNKRAHEVHLSKLAREILDGLPVVEGCRYVLTTTGRSPVSGFSKLKVRLDKIIANDGGGEIPPWRLHDLRRTAATGMVELGTAPHVVEVALNHISGARAGVAGVYNRAELRHERREALERWGEHVRRLVSPPADNVVQLNRYAASSG